jgi:hypothetical protein
VVRITADEMLVRSSLDDYVDFTYPNASMFSRSHSTLDGCKPMQLFGMFKINNAYTSLISARPAFTGAARAPGKPQTLNR